MPKYVYVGKTFTGTLPTADKQTDQGLTTLKVFREELKYRRLKELKDALNITDADTANTFTLSLGFNGEKDSTDDTKVNYQMIYVDFFYWKSGTETIEKVQIKVEQQTDGQPAYVIRYLDIDSDITEYVFRFTDGLDWAKRTYMLLDFNPNQCVNKGAYVVLNAAFNNNIGWIENNRKLVEAYKIGDTASVTKPVNSTYGSHN